MLRFTSICICFLLFQICNAQNCFQAIGSGDYFDENSKSMVTDQSGNVITTGFFFSDTIFIGGSMLANHSASCDIFLVKQNPNGQVLWTESFGSALDDEGRAIAVDASDNIYVAGYFRGDSITFGNTTFYNQLIGFSDGYLLKIDPNGTLIWARQIGVNTQDEMVNGIAVDGGDVYVTGRFHSSTVTFDGIIIYNSDTTGGTFDSFIAQYNSSGIIQWAKAISGNRLDQSNSVTAFNNHCYVTGNYNSDTLTSDGQNLVNLHPGSYQIFVVAYNHNGTSQWMRTSSGPDMATSYAITNDGNSVYVGGQFRSTYIFGSDTLRSRGGWYDAVVLKYDIAGNVIWAKSYGGNGEDDACYGLAKDLSNNIYLAGHFMSDTLFLGSINLFNSSMTNNRSNSFAAEINPNGVVQWAVSMGGNNVCRTVAIGSGGVYLGGYFLGNMLMPNDTLISNGQQDLYVVHPYGFTANTIATDATCNGASNGMVSLSINGGMNPLHILWSNGDTTALISNLPADTYAVNVNDSNRCIINDTSIVSEPAADSIKICMVTVDEFSQHNIIMWDKTPFTDVDSFLVYREVATNNYQVIASIPYDSLSAFTDTVSQRFFPNTGNPNIGTYRYKLQAHDTCGGSTMMSPYHNTIFMINNNGTFSWPQLYTIENGPNPVNNYILMRDDSSNGNWHIIGSVTGTQQSISDPQYSIWQHIASWRVETGWAVQCTPTRMSTQVLTKSSSNIYSESIINNVKQIIHSSVDVFPNPTSGEFSISARAIREIRIMDFTGKKIIDLFYENKSSVKLDLSGFAPGIYYLDLVLSNETVLKKIVLN